MKMHNPPHPGEIIRSAYLEHLDMSTRELARHLDVSASTINRLIKGESGISPEMAMRLSICLGRSPESWLRLQDNYDLWHINKKKSIFKAVKKIEIPKNIDAA
mgnify:CR=1 FL=1